MEQPALLKDLGKLQDQGFELRFASGLEKLITAVWIEKTLFRLPILKTGYGKLVRRRQTSCQLSRAISNLQSSR